MRFHYFLVKTLLFFLPGLIFVGSSFWRWNSLISITDSIVCLDRQCWVVELALNPRQWQEGLMGREKLNSDQGMLFIFPRAAKYSFWMKNVTFPLDIVWISEDKKVVDWVLGAKPCLENFCPSFKPRFRVRYVLEVPSGYLREDFLINNPKVFFLISP